MLFLPCGFHIVFENENAHWKVDSYFILNYQGLKEEENLNKGLIP